MVGSLRQRKERALWDKLAIRYDRQVMGVYRNAYTLSVEKILEVASSLDVGQGKDVGYLGSCL